MADYARGEKLRRLRDDRRLSQEDAAHEIGVTSKTLRAWEHGGPISWKNAQRAGGFYGVEPESLVSRELLEPEVNGPQTEALERIEQRQGEILTALSRIETQLASRTSRELPQQPVERQRRRRATQ